MLFLMLTLPVALPHREVLNFACPLLSFALTLAATPALILALSFAPDGVTPAQSWAGAPTGLALRRTRWSSPSMLGLKFSTGVSHWRNRGRRTEEVRMAAISKMSEDKTKKTRRGRTTATIYWR